MTCLKELGRQFKASLKEKENWEKIYKDRQNRFALVEKDYKRYKEAFEDARDNLKYLEEELEIIKEKILSKSLSI